MSNLILILPDQISENLASLKNINKVNDKIVFYEYLTPRLKHHPKKIAFLIASLRRFAHKLKSENFNVEIYNIEEASLNFEKDILDIAAKYNYTKITITEALSYRENEILHKISNKLKIEILPDNRFLSSKDFFLKWSEGKKQLRMEFFYREMRRKHNILIQNDIPEGGKWNYDSENRKPPDENMKFPGRISHKKNDILIDVLKYVEENFSEHFGDLYPFHYATNHEEAKKEADHFLNEILPLFGNYQDAMVVNEAYLYHSLLSSYINNGLLDPLYLIKEAEVRFYNKNAPLNAVEGFIRQILGWREYIRGIYWKYMPYYAEMNYLEANNSLPAFYWGEKTNMRCILESVNHTKTHAYSHHIQRLMVTGNFALIASIDPEEVDNWYGAVYSDAFEWVHMPNTRGMSLYADGGIIASKPYASSGKYINKMSNYCKSCKYDPNISFGENACPFNSLYWNFIIKNKMKFKDNQRMKYVYSTWERMDESKRISILDQADYYLQKIKSEEII